MNPALASGTRLFLVGTPIGNLEDISLRALRILKSVDLIAAEDTRRTQKLLTHYDIHKPLISYYKDVEQRKTGELIAAMQAGQSVALVTDAGMPGISDPGVLLVRAAREQGIAMEIIPGPSAVLTALAGSGLPLDAFTFHGFPDPKPGPRKKEFENYRKRPETQVFFVAPHRLKETLEDLLAVWGDREAVLCRELTKLHEEFQTGRISDLRAGLERQEARGEYTLVVAGSREEDGDEAGRPEESLENHLARLQREGLSLNQAVGRAARERNLPRQEVYRLAHQKKASDLSDSSGASESADETD